MSHVVIRHVEYTTYITWPSYMCTRCTYNEMFYNIGGREGGREGGEESGRKEGRKEGVRGREEEKEGKGGGRRRRRGETATLMMVFLLCWLNWYFCWQSGCMRR